MDKKSLNEQEIRSIFIRPAIQNAGWTASQIREEYVITKGRIVARGGISKRDDGKRADYVLFYKPHIPLAIIEAKDNNHSKIRVTALVGYYSAENSIIDCCLGRIVMEILPCFSRFWAYSTKSRALLTECHT